MVKDSYYMDRRNNTTLIARGCNTVYEDCFCTMVGGSPYNFENADMGIYELDDDYVVKVFTEKGQQLADKYGDFLKPAPNDADYYSKALDDRESQSSKKINALWGELIIRISRKS
ncbi:MAG: hypothetical protein U5N58_08950 [Actinomycetota bacterium]|nr:hypothetical protein [Actinomycetota bacterium]